jgi:putative transposase
MTGLLALVRMPQAPQSTRTFFVTSTTAGRRALLQSDRMAQLLVDVLAENRRKRRFLLHEFVIMPNHFHLLLTPAAEIPLEKALKGGFSYRAKREIHFAFEIWQASFLNHRIRDAEDYKHHHTYIWENPVRAGLSERPELFAWSSASLGMELDAPPPGLKPSIYIPERSRGFENPLPWTKVRGWHSLSYSLIQLRQNVFRRPIRSSRNVETRGPGR